MSAVPGEVVIPRHPVPILILLLSSVLAPSSTLRAVARNSGGECWVAPLVPLSCLFLCPLSLGLLLPVSTLRAVAHSGSDRCWIPQALENVRVAGAYLMGTAQAFWHLSRLVLDPNKPLTSHLNGEEGVYTVVVENVT